MEFALTEDQRSFQQAARDFAEQALAPHAAHWDADEVFPREAIAQAGALGFCGLYTCVENPYAPSKVDCSTGLAAASTAERIVRGRGASVAAKSGRS